MVFLKWAKNIQDVSKYTKQLNFQYLPIPEAIYVTKDTYNNIKQEIQSRLNNGLDNNKISDNYLDMNFSVGSFKLKKGDFIESDLYKALVEDKL